MGLHLSIQHRTMEQIRLNQLQKHDIIKEHTISKKQGFQREHVEYWVSKLTPLLTQQAASISSNQVSLNVVPFVNKKYINCTQNVKINNYNISIITQVLHFIDTNHRCVMTWWCRGSFMKYHSYQITFKIWKTCRFHKILIN